MTCSTRVSTSCAAPGAATPVSHDGTHYQLDSVDLLPPPVQSVGADLGRDRARERPAGAPGRRARRRVPRRPDRPTAARAAGQRRPAAARRPRRLRRRGRRQHRRLAAVARRRCHLVAARAALVPSHRGVGPGSSSRGHQTDEPPCNMSHITGGEAVRTKPWHGVLVANALPYNAELEVDFDRYAEHVAWLAASGCDGVTPNGSLGEYQILTAEERAARRRDRGRGGAGRLLGHARAWPRTAPRRRAAGPSRPPRPAPPRSCCCRPTPTGPTTRSGRRPLPRGRRRSACRSSPTTTRSTPRST